MADEVITAEEETREETATVSLPIPKTIEQKYLYALAGGSIDTLPVPKTRVQMYLAHMCGWDGTLPKPITRVQQYIYTIATANDNIDDGSNDGESSPTT